MNAKKIMLTVFALLFSMPFAVSGQNRLQAEPSTTDYSNPSHWISVPIVVDKKVEVFYLAPTAWQNYNLRQNAANRVEKYFDKRKGE